MAKSDAASTAMSRNADATHAKLAFTAMSPSAIDFDATPWTTVELVLSQHRGCGRNAGGEVLELSRRQKEVLALLADGLTDEEIGLRLGISSRTARAHVDALKGKLGVARRREIPSAYHRLTGKDPFSGEI